MSDLYSGGVLLAEVVRSGFVESWHRGSVVVLDAAGAVVHAAGDTTAPVFPRSSNKPFQAVGMLRAGLPARGADLALACASHRGQEIHLAGVGRLLAQAGCTVDDLLCPVDSPIAEPGGPRSRDRHNCSGKHSAMLLTCRDAGWPIEGYTDPEHPLQRAVAEAVVDVVREPIAATGVDGCGAPVFAFSLHALARGFLALVHAAEGSHERTVADAMRAHPEMVSGIDEGAHDTRLMRALPGLLAKGGAEGVQAVAVPGVGAVAIKIDDGQKRALMPVLQEALKRVGTTLEVPSEPVLGGGRQVGVVRPVV
ncbi:asparaginase [Virgisporangium aliadipatigenens]|uniref:Asparaginase n=1 Tax=Virgisporangium aliadipatigenens TaxID=741659 RepID=A0A8J3YRQ5_9ACTN|nr:asparaginase [Virgisporangium aliadipatigenens]GIJ48621.1 asparaginase [Virgisporangium aliadipatigenens]